MIPSTVIAQVSELARTIPADLARAIANQIDATADSEWVNARGAILAVVPQANARHQVAQLLDEWPLAAPTGSRRTLAWALAASAQTASAEREEERVSLVWTGPHVDVQPCAAPTRRCKR